MKNTMELSREEGLKVVEAMKKVAFDSGWAEEDLVDCGILEEYAKVLDASLAALGITLLVNPNPSEEEEEEEEDEDDPIEAMLYDLDDGRTAISFEDACSLMDEIQEVGMECGLSEKDATEVAKCIFMQIAKEYGIDEVEADDEEEEEEEEEDEEEPPSYPEILSMILGFLFGQ